VHLHIPSHERDFKCDEVCRGQDEASVLHLISSIMFESKPKAFDWLDRAVVQRDPGLINIKTDPLLAGLRGDTRYKTVLRKMNLPD
jgi:hypothetical protein